MKQETQSQTNEKSVTNMLEEEITSSKNSLSEEITSTQQVSHVQSLEQSTKTASTHITMTQTITYSTTVTIDVKTTLLEQQKATEENSQTNLPPDFNISDEVRIMSMSRVATKSLSKASLKTPLMTSSFTKSIRPKYRLRFGEGTQCILEPVLPKGMTKMKKSLSKSCDLPMSSADSKVGLDVASLNSDERPTVSVLSLRKAHRFKGILPVNDIPVNDIPCGSSKSVSKISANEKKKTMSLPNHFHVTSEDGNIDFETGSESSSLSSHEMIL